MSRYMQDVSTAKEGIVGLTRTLALDLGKYGVTANAIRPRAATRLTISPEMAEARERTLAARSRGAAPAETSADQAISGIAALQPELVAPLVVWLTSDAASNVNGRDFLVGGNEISLMSLPERERTIYHEGGFTLDVLDRVFSSTLGAGLKNPAPAQAPKEAAPA